jgi:chemotaxis protein MotB
MGGKKEKEDLKMPSCPLWMLTFGDCMSLLLTFFVMILSFTVFDEEVVEQMLGSFRSRLGLMTTDRAAIYEEVVRQSKTGQVPGSKTGIDDPNLVKLGLKKEDTELYRTLLLSRQAREALKGAGTYEMIDVAPLVKGVSIRVRNAALFDPGQASLREEAKPLLYYFVSILAELPNEIEIEGHTDDELIRSSRFPSNWELSAARAASVAEYFIDNGIDPLRLGIKPCADTRALKPNDSIAHREENRRVEIVVKGLKRGEYPDYHGGEAKEKR